MNPDTNSVARACGTASTPPTAVTPGSGPATARYARAYNSPAAAPATWWTANALRNPTDDGRDRASTDAAMYAGVNPSACFAIGKSITTAANTPQAAQTATNGASAAVGTPPRAAAGVDAGDTVS